MIAAINGPAVGVGRHDDAADGHPPGRRRRAKFGFVFARRGIVPEACSSWFLPRVVGINTAAGVDVDRAGCSAPTRRSTAGLVRSVHAPDDLLPAAYALAAEIADNTSAVSVAMTRQMLWRMLGEDHPMAAHRVDSQRRSPSWAGPPTPARACCRFLEKRPAAFTDQVPADIPAPWPFWEEPEFSPLDG